ncbi:mechanosensitive ion channel family protein [Pseudomonas sp. LS1212]|uniref:mechanosensitive ion channel family protein n=1 Tax=Pseudomonas sp. LS1212 TaxID=2972478 RepID=UPI0038CD392E
MFRSTLKYLLLLSCILGSNAYAEAPPPAQPAKAEPVVIVQGGLLETISSGLDDIQHSLELDGHVLDDWRLRADRAADEIDQLVNQQASRSTLGLIGDFALLSLAWLGTFAPLNLLGQMLTRHFNRQSLLLERPRAQRLLGYLLHYILPAMISLPLMLYASRFFEPSPARALALCLGYATSCGLIINCIVLCLITAFDSGHRRAAVRIIRHYLPRPLFLVGSLVALSDALTSPQIARQLGSNVTSTVAVLTGLLATLAFAILVVKLRRPVAHLIRNRDFDQRRQNHAVQETLRIFSSLWYYPILLMILVSAVNLIGAGQESQRVLQNALLTSLLLIATVFLSTLFQHMFKVPARVAEQRLQPYKELLRSLTHAALRIILAIAFIELSGRIWGFSVIEFALKNSMARAISDSLSSIGLVLLVTWLLWVVIDTAIQEALKPPVGRRGGHQPSTRAKTILPMLRNAVKIILVVICAITTMANLGINVAPLLAGAGVVGLAIGFGSQQLVQDVITGLFILIEDTIAIGDWVVLDSGHAGTVESLTIRTLRLRDGKGFVHSVPFGQIKAVTNQSRQFAYAFFSIQVSYESDIDTALDMIRQVGHSISDDPLLKHNLQGPLQVFGVDKMDLNGITLTAQFRTISGGQYGINRAFNERLKKLVDQTDKVSFAQYYPQASLPRTGEIA